MEGRVAMAAGGSGVSSNSRISSNGDNWRLENPFSFRVLQVFTGVGVGCGMGIGVGKPIYLGAIPALQQVLSATRGAADIFSGAGRHVNTNLRRFGIKNLEAGIGCGVGIGHGFGVGIALKPGVIHRIQACFGEAVAKVMTNFGSMPGISGLQSDTTASVHGSADAHNRSYSKPAGTPVENVLRLTTKHLGVNSSSEETDRSPTVDSTDGFQSLKAATSEIPMARRTEKVISNFLQSPIFNNEEEVELDALARKLRSENNLVQMLLKHQKVIDELIEENEKLRRILVEDLKVSPGKLETSSDRRGKHYYPCSDCIECRRKRRSSR